MNKIILLDDLTYDINNLDIIENLINFIISLGTTNILFTIVYYFYYFLFMMINLIPINNILLRIIKILFLFRVSPYLYIMAI